MTNTRSTEDEKADAVKKAIKKLQAELTSPDHPTSIDQSGESRHRQIKALQQFLEFANPESFARLYDILMEA